MCSLPGWSSWFPASVGLEPADLTGAVSGHGGDQLAVLVDDAQAGIAELNGDNLAGVGEADLDALPGDLDAAAAGSAAGGNGQPARLTPPSGICSAIRARPGG